MQALKIIAFTHKTIDIEEIGSLHVDESARESRLHFLKENAGLDELMYISTCNRVEFVIANNQDLDSEVLAHFFASFQPAWGTKEINWAIDRCQIFVGLQACRHLFGTAASIDSLVIGEREIITQVRKSYHESADLGLTGDRIRLLVKHTIEAAKEVYTETDIAKNPVSVVSLAYRELRDLNVSEDARIVIIGAGETNENLSKYIRKHGFKNFKVYNRTQSKALALAETLGGEALPLARLEEHTGGFDVIITCTGSEDPIITEAIYENMLQGEMDRKIIVDLAVPADLDKKVLEKNAINYIAVNTLNEIAERNKKEREKDLKLCWEIIEKNIDRYEEGFRVREIELALQGIPQEVKSIRERAFSEVFAKDIAQMDEQTQDLLGDMVTYFEKKYIGLPMKMAREILVGKSAKKKN
jgi:glutamyl-tRNA reductase